MRTTFFGFELARRAIATQQRALDVTGHNITNASSPGYSRQRVVQTATLPWAEPALNRPLGPGQIGTGVMIRQIERLHDAFIESQINRETQSHSRWDAKRTILTQIELIVNEPTDSGVRHAMDKLWEGLQDLSTEPESMPARSVVAERANSLAEAIRSARARLDAVRNDINVDIRTDVNKLNSLGAQIAALNKQIAEVNAVGQNPNDLLDRRDVLLRQAAELTGVQVVDRPNGQIAVLIGGVALADGKTHRDLRFNEDTGEIEWVDTGMTAHIGDGRIRGLFESRDETIPGYIAALDEFTATLIAELNAIHAAGYDLTSSGQPSGLDFFTGSDSTTIAFNSVLYDDLELIAASGNGNDADGSNALAMAQLRFALVMNNGTATLDEFYAATVARLGVEAQEADRYLEQQEMVLGYLDRVRESVSGVSLDEELANLIQFQHAYNAAARMLTTMDEAIDMIINRMGLVGR